MANCKVCLYGVDYRDGVSSEVLCLWKKRVLRTYLRKCDRFVDTGLLPDKELESEEYKELKELKKKIPKIISRATYLAERTRCGYV